MNNNEGELMYAYGCYRLNGYEMEPVYSMDYALSDAEVVLREIVDPLIKIQADYRAGKMPLYPSREKWLRTISWLEKESPYTVNYLPSWEDVEKDGSGALYDIFLEEDSNWTIFTDSAQLMDEMLQVKDHGLDPHAIYQAVKAHVREEDLVFIVDWMCNDYCVLNSPYVGGRQMFTPTAGCQATSDAEVEGDTGTYILPPWFIDEIITEFTERYKYEMDGVHGNGWPVEASYKDCIEEGLIDEFGHIPGELSSRCICIPNNGGGSRLDRELTFSR